MIIQCESCSRKFVVNDKDIPTKGRKVQCGYCSTSWHQLPVLAPKKIDNTNEDEDLSIDGIKASDGKTYKFLTNQWAELLPSGKTGLFAKKKISNELDKLTGRKRERKVKKEKVIKQTTKEFDPSAEGMDSNKKLTDNYDENKGMGLFGYIFIIIIISFSLVGFLKTFEEDLIVYFPEQSYIFELLDLQLEFLAESVKNIIVIVQDLINSY